MSKYISVALCSFLCGGIVILCFIRGDNMQTSEKIAAVEHGLRYTVKITGEPDVKMSIVDRMAHYRVPGVSIAVIDNGKIAWAKGYGAVSFHPDSSPITTDTLFQAGSISKFVAAIGFLKLAQDESVSLDNDVNQYLSSWVVPENALTQTEKVTLRRLLSHSAGISTSWFPGYAQGEVIPSVVQILDGVQPYVNTEAVRVIQSPGTKFQYSGGGTTIAQQLLEDVTKTSFDAWMEKNVLLPLGMQHSTYAQPLPQVRATEAAHGHLVDGSEVSGYWHTYPEMAAAGLWTTPADLAKAAIAIQCIFNGKIDGVLHPEMVSQMLTAQARVSNKMSTGLGVFLYNNTNTMAFEHAGLDKGFLAKMYMLTQQGQGIVVMVNGDAYAYYLVQEIINSVADVYHWPSMPVIERAEFPLALIENMPFLGDFYMKDDPESMLKIYCKEGALFAQQTGMPAVQLHAYAKNKYFTKEEDQRFAFSEKNGDIEVLISFEDPGLFEEDLQYYKKI